MTTQYQRFNRQEPNRASAQPHTDIAGLADCLRERRRFVAALDKGDQDHARRRLVRGYLPALAELAAGVDPERIAADVAALVERMDRGLAYGGPERERADDLFVELLTEYEVLSDALNLAHEGTPRHPASYLLERVSLRCRS